MSSTIQGLRRSARIRNQQKRKLETEGTNNNRLTPREKRKKSTKPSSSSSKRGSTYGGSDPREVAQAREAKRQILLKRQTELDKLIKSSEANMRARDPQMREGAPELHKSSKIEKEKIVQELKQMEEKERESKEEGEKEFNEPKQEIKEERRPKSKSPSTAREPTTSSEEKSQTGKGLSWNQMYAPYRDAIGHRGQRDDDVRLKYSHSSTGQARRQKDKRQKEKEEKEIGEKFPGRGGRRTRY